MQGFRACRAHHAALTLEGRDCVLLDDVDALVGVVLLVEVRELRGEQAGHEAVLGEDDADLQTIQGQSCGRLQSNVASSDNGGL